MWYNQTSRVESPAAIQLARLGRIRMQNVDGWRALKSQASRNPFACVIPCSFLIAWGSFAAAGLAAIPPITSEGWIDGRLAFGNGYVFGTFVSPMEEPAYPYTKVCDRICRLWFDYPSPQQC